jgi:hypothetical protein
MTDITEIFKPKRHNLIKQENGKYSCTVCEWTWDVKPSPLWECPGLKRYAWGQTPNHLKTGKQLAMMGYQPAKPPEGCFADDTRKQIVYLYDETQVKLKKYR